MKGWLETSAHIRYVDMNVGDIDVTAKKGQIKEIDAREQDIRDNAEYYSVTMFRGGTSGRPPAPHFDTLDEALEYAKQELSPYSMYRSAMIYAVNKHERSALCGSMNKTLKWKAVVPQRYK